ncbi:MAG: Nif3-like dinuclear metal center hexameric protein [Gammaproteobacteria bacterium 28-57-27]|nr:MAG: Nif3-like dinuclear metal center hexameric protein [Gammaproteobacteria bacterium 28-57-27]
MTSAVARETLLSYCEQLLRVEAYADCAPNGLQVEGGSRVKRIVSGVTASQALLEAAVEQSADMVLVHHGYFWKGEDARVVGMKRKRLATLLAHDINLVAYHLPLDGHPVYGNNAQWAMALGLKETQGFLGAPSARIGVRGVLPEAQTGVALKHSLERILGREVLHIPAHEAERPLRSLGLCSGGAQGYIAEAAALGLDAYLSGEISEQTVHIAREMGIDYFACGHHATERFGVRALGEHLADTFGIEHCFVDMPNPA